LKIQALIKLVVELACQAMPQHSVRIKQVVTCQAVNLSSRIWGKVSYVCLSISDGCRVMRVGNS